MYYSGILDSLINDLAADIAQKEEELTHAPEGSLYRLKKADGMYYYNLLPPRGFRKKKKRVGITKDKDMIHRLARKRYLKESLSLARRNLQILQEASAAYVPHDPASLRAALRGPYADLPLEMFTPLVPPPKPGAYNQWENDYRKEELTQTSHDGVPMRTKSEVNIAGRLGHFGVENVYEKPLELNRKIYRPDFTIKRPRDGKTIYWEHAGLMEDPKYRARHERKLRDYEQYGIVPWRNLIITYDDDKGGIDVKLVDALIRGWLL